MPTTGLEQKMTFIICSKHRRCAGGIFGVKAGRPEKPVLASSRSGKKPIWSRGGTSSRGGRSTAKFVERAGQWSAARRAFERNSRNPGYW